MRFLLLFLSLIATAPAWAQANVLLNYQSDSGAVQVSTTNRLPVAATITPSGTQNVNVTQVGGNPVTTTVPVSGSVSLSGSSIPALSSQYPASATAITASNTGTVAATAATLVGAVGKTTYVCGFSITSDATAGLAGTATVAGVITGTMTYIQGVGAAPSVASLNQTFSPCIPASAVNTSIVVTSAAAGTGGSTAVNAWGYQL